MLQIVLTTPVSSNHGKAEMFIDYQEESIGFTVVTDEKKQYDFDIEKEDWETFKNFIESQFEIRSGKD
jgi:hypothetical protein